MGWYDPCGSCGAQVYVTSGRRLPRHRTPAGSWCLQFYADRSPEELSEYAGAYKEMNDAAQHTDVQS